jgi:hypothetical protein
MFLPLETIEKNAKSITIEERVLYTPLSLLSGTTEESTAEAIAQTAHISIHNDIFSNLLTLQKSV